jgi:hypothetical protein
LLLNGILAKDFASPLGLRKISLFDIMINK